MIAKLVNITRIQDNSDLLYDSLQLAYEPSYNWGVTTSSIDHHETNTDSCWVSQLGPLAGTQNSWQAWVLGAIGQLSNEVTTVLVYF